MDRFSAFLLFTLIAVAPASAQVQGRPTDPPVVTAENESWFVNGEALQFAGDLYYPAGARVFFNGNTMVRSGHYNGVPLYTDTTIEPYSIVYVPIQRGLVQPYERPRQGALAGTVASRTPSFPVRIASTALASFGSFGMLPQAAVAPTALPTPIGAISAYTPEPPIAPFVPVVAPVAVITNSATPQTNAENGITFATIGRPASNDGVWIRYLGEKWISAGLAMPIAPESFRVVGSYEGFPVFSRKEGTEQIIYVPTRGGLAAPYRLKQ
jgi:hypothetical protein